MPSVQEVKEGESESEIHPRPTCQMRSGPRRATESARGLFVPLPVFSHTDNISPMAPRVDVRQEVIFSN